jgi:xanthine/uracil permease
MTSTPKPTSPDLLASVLWFVVIVPPAFGFWLVAGDLAGVESEDLRTLLTASMLAVGLATLLQMTLGYRIPVYEGPAGNYLAAIAVLAVSDPNPAEMTGGLLVAGAVVLAFGLLRADRLLGALFTPPVVQVFLFDVVILAGKPTIERALALDGHGPQVAAVISAVIVVACAVGLQRVSRLRPYALLAALLLGTLAYFWVDGFPQPELNSAVLETPRLMPWGAPEIDLSIAAPFAIAAVLASFNTIASMRVMSTAIQEPLRPEAGRRGLLVDGGAQAANACLGNVLGHVPRLDAAGVVSLIRDKRSITLGLTAAATIVLALVGPVIDLLVLLPIPVSASLLAVILGIIVIQGLRSLAGMDARARWLVFAPAVAPAPLWLLLEGGLSESAQLLTNPLLVGVLAAIVLDRVVPRTALAN